MSTWCGTSVGAINAAALAALAHLPADKQAQQAAAPWEALRKHDVIAPIVGSGGARTLLRLVGHTLGLPGVGLASVLDPSPLAGSLDRWIDWRLRTRCPRPWQTTAAWGPDDPELSVRRS